MKGEVGWRAGWRIWWGGWGGWVLGIEKAESSEYFFGAMMMGFRSPLIIRVIREEIMSMRLQYKLPAVAGKCRRNQVCTVSTTRHENRED